MRKAPVDDGKYAHIIEAASLATWEWNVQTGDVAFNDRWFELIGYEPGELPLRIETWKNLVHPDDLERVMNSLDDHLEGKTENYCSEYRLRCKDGSWRWVLDTGKVIEKDSKGKPLTAAGIHIDIDDRKRMEERLHLSEKKYVSVLENSPINIYLVDRDSMRIIEANSALSSLLGYSREELLEMTPYDFIFHDKEDVDGKVSGLPEEHYGFVGERKYVTKCGKVLDVEVSANIIEFGEKKVISVVSWDVSELKKVQRELMEMNEVLTLIGKISRHDIRNRLAVALGLIGLRREGLSDDPMMIEEAYKSIQRAVDITKRMNDLEKLMTGGGRLERRDINEIIENVLSSHSVKYRIKGRCQAFVDDAFDSVVENLVTNAITHGRATRINVEMTEQDGKCRVSFEDNGKGIPEDIIGELFNEGVSWGETRGTGLGLYIVRKVIERYGGKVWFEAARSGGARFVLTLPKKMKELKIEPTVSNDI